MKYPPLMAVLVIGLVVGFAWSLLDNSTQDSPLYHLRVASYPSTFISQIDVVLTAPSEVRLTWVGPDAKSQPAGPFKASVGSGCGTNDCNDEIESNCLNSECTPKGTHYVEQMMDNLKRSPACRFATFINRKRAIALHSHTSVPDHPSSNGCIRLEIYPAQLIHNNSVVKKTKVVVEGTWKAPATEKIRVATTTEIEPASKSEIQSNNH